MEDYLYHNLENYNEEQTISELKNENASLKVKLQEYSSSLENLQANILQEFDKLFAEHTKLAANYSSLMKTARAEVERKSQIINKMNEEKDAMVLNSVQNRNLHYKSRNAHNPKPSENIKTEPKPVNKPVNSPDVSSVKNYFNERKEPIKQTDGPKRFTETKENFHQRQVEDKPKSCSKIRDRRKSMPAFSAEVAKFSTDEEDAFSSEYNNESKDQGRNRDSKRAPDYNTERNYPNESRGRYNKNVYDDKRDKVNHWDKNEFREQRHKRRHGSPEHYRRGSRDLLDDYHDDRRKRFDSPPNERHLQFPRKSRDSYRTSYDKRTPPPPPQPSFDKQAYERQEHERFRARNHDKYSMKHKMSNDYEEPTNKRMKADHQRSYEVDRWRNEQIHEPFDETPYTTCQSPDSLHFESNPNHQIREIKLNAPNNTKLDDPRTKSRKYEVHNKEGKVIFSTVQSKDMIVQPINKAKWHMETVKLPAALTNRPPAHYNELNQVSDIETISNHSRETGELRDSDKESNINIHRNVMESVVQPPVQLQTIAEAVPVIDIKVGVTETKVEQSEDIQKAYKIPKKKGNGDPKKKAIADLKKKEPTVLDSNKQSTKPATESLPTISTPLLQNIDVDAASNSNLKTQILEKKAPPFKESSKSSDRKSINDKRKAPNVKCTVADDLAMSDDNDGSEEDQKSAKAKENNKSSKESSSAKDSKEGKIASDNSTAPVTIEKHNTQNDDKKNVKVKEETVDKKTKPKRNRKDSKQSINKESKEEEKSEKCRKKDKLIKDQSEAQNLQAEVPIAEKTNYQEKTIIEQTDGKEKAIKRKDSEVVEKSQIPKDVQKDATGQLTEEIPPEIKRDRRDSKQTIEVPKETTGQKIDDNLPVPKVSEKGKKKDKKDKTKNEQKHTSEASGLPNISDHVPKFDEPVGKAKEIKNKFSELFGDSNSLITPEDLGLPATVVPPVESNPLFEDAQDANDVNNSSTKEPKTYVQLTPVSDSFLISLSEDVEKEPEHKEMEDISIKDIYENLEVGDPTDDNAVKTVIISTGVQPVVEPVTMTELVNVDPASVTNVPMNYNLKPLLQVDSMKALATSTPQKLPMVQTETACNPIDNREVNIENAIRAMRNSESEDMNGKPKDADIPDVRIFVKRRRRLVKK